MVGTKMDAYSIRVPPAYIDPYTRKNADERVVAKANRN
jgi:hypothetical protein